jgi:polysaccharide export outer membrane protein
MFQGEQEKDAQTKVSDDDYKKETQFDWKIGKGDRVQINILNQTSGEGDQQPNQILSQSGAQTLTRDGTEGFLIPTDGKVRLPLVGEVNILGLTENQAAEKISNLFKSYLRHPYVNVKILNQKLFVLGEVSKPGVVQVTNGTMSLLEALAYSGDITVDGQRTNILVIRGGLRKPKVREIDLTDLSKLSFTSLILLPNDVVYVQPRGMKAYNVAFNEQLPFFNMLTSMITPFISLDTLHNTGGINVILGK